MSNANCGRKTFYFSKLNRKFAKKMRKLPEVAFLRRKSVPCHPAANRKNTTTAGKSKTPGTLIYNVPGSRSGGIPLRAAADMVATPHCGARFLSVEKGFDEISATGGHRILSPRPFGPEFEDLDFRPSNANFRHFPPVVQ